jgi:hypothetical protein
MHLAKKYATWSILLLGERVRLGYANRLGEPGLVRVEGPAEARGRLPEPVGRYHTRYMAALAGSLYFPVSRSTTGPKVSRERCVTVM